MYQKNKNLQKSKNVITFSGYQPKALIARGSKILSLKSIFSKRSIFQNKGRGGSQSFSGITFILSS
jgi:hypothetical protein